MVKLTGPYFIDNGDLRDYEGDKIIKAEFLHYFPHSDRIYTINYGDRKSCTTIVMQNGRMLFRYPVSHITQSDIRCVLSAEGSILCMLLHDGVLLFSNSDGVEPVPVTAFMGLEILHISCGSEYFVVSLPGVAYRVYYDGSNVEISMPYPETYVGEYDNIISQDTSERYDLDMSAGVVDSVSFRVKYQNKMIEHLMVLHQDLTLRLYISLVSEGYSIVEIRDVLEYSELVDNERFIVLHSDKTLKTYYVRFSGEQYQVVKTEELKDTDSSNVRFSYYYRKGKI